MKRVFLILMTLILSGSSFADAQVVNEFRIRTTYMGKTENGLRRFYMIVESNNTGKWKAISKADITTGRNLQMATIVPDSNTSVLKFKDLLQNAEFKPLYELTLNEYMDRIDTENPDAINTPRNETDHKIFRDSETGNIVISIKAGEKDTEAIVRICAFDNSKMVVLNKGLRTFSGNFIEVSPVVLGPGNYIVIVTTPTCRFSEKFLIL